MKHEGFILRFFEKIKSGVCKYEELVCVVLAILWLGIVLSVSAIFLVPLIKNKPVPGLIGSFLLVLSISGSLLFAVRTMILLVGCFKFIVSRYFLKWRQEPFSWKDMGSYLWEDENTYFLKKEIEKMVSKSKC